MTEESKDTRPFLQRHRGFPLIVMGALLAALGVYGILTTPPFTPDRFSSAVMMGLGFFVIMMATIIDAVSL